MFCTSLFESSNVDTISIVVIQYKDVLITTAGFAREAVSLFRVRYGVF